MKSIIVLTIISSVLAYNVGVAIAMQNNLDTYMNYVSCSL